MTSIELLIFTLLIFAIWFVLLIFPRLFDMLIDWAYGDDGGDDTEEHF